MNPTLRRFFGAGSGSVATIVALALPVLIGASAFGVDVGVFFLERRALQKAADAAALAAVADLDHADAAARRMLASNGQDAARFTLRFGRYSEDPALARDERFEAGPKANAVSIEATHDVPTLFGRVFGQSSATLAVRSQAAVTPVVSFAIGSRLASADPLLVDALTRPLIGTSLGLDVMDYRALARSRIRVGAWLREIAAAGGIAPDARLGEVTRRPVPLSAVLSVTAGELNRTGDPAGASALRKAARNIVGAALRVEPGDLLGLDDGTDDLRLDYPNDALAARTSVLSLLSAAVTDRSIGNEMAAQLGFPGILEADVGLLLGEGDVPVRGVVVERLAEGASGAATAQARLRLALHAGAGALVPDAKAVIPFELVLAGARATVLSATCSADPAQREVRLAVQPGLVRLSIGRSVKPLDAMTVGDAVQPAEVLPGAPAQVTMEGSIALRRLTTGTAAFRGTEIGDGTMRTVRTRNLAESLVTSLIDETAIGVRLGSLELDLGLPDTVKRAARTLLAGLGRPADAIIDATLAFAGVGLGEADVRVDDLVCGHARLVG